MAQNTHQESFRWGQQMYKLALLIPTYNHYLRLDALCQELQSYNYPIIIINDGSHHQATHKIKSIVKKFSTYYVQHSTNQGKGAAVISGCAKAHQINATHILQIDADFQHNIKDIDQFIDASINHPTAVISGKPNYKEDAPKSRVIGRKITTFWIAIESLSLRLQDGLCGFRIYPVNSLLSLNQSVNLSKRMQFDFEVLVRLAWRNCHFIFIDTVVRYPHGNTSNFRVVKDNLAISLTHTKLVLLMLLYSPHIIYKRMIKK